MNKLFSRCEWRLLALFLLVGTITLWAQLCAADFDAYIYEVVSNNRKSVSWTAPESSVDGYEVQVIKIQKLFSLASGTVVYRGTTTLPTITINWKTPGLYYINARAFRNLPGGTTKEYGSWKNTLDPTVGEVNGVPRAWALYVSTY